VTGRSPPQSLPVIVNNTFQLSWTGSHSQYEVLVIKDGSKTFLGDLVAVSHSFAVDLSSVCASKVVEVTNIVDVWEGPQNIYIEMKGAPKPNIWKPRRKQRDECANWLVDGLR
jgi:hypothetical protein